MIISTITENRNLTIRTDEEKLVSNLDYLFLNNNIPYRYIKEKRTSLFLIKKEHVVDALYYITCNQDLLIT